MIICYISGGARCCRCSLERLRDAAAAAAAAAAGSCSCCCCLPMLLPNAVARGCCCRFQMGGIHPDCSDLLFRWGGRHL